MPGHAQTLTAILVDDGTLDTVYECSECQERLRYVDGDEMEFSRNIDILNYFRKMFYEDHESD